VPRSKDFVTSRGRKTRALAGVLDSVAAEHKMVGFSDD